MTVRSFLTAALTAVVVFSAAPAQAASFTVTESLVDGEPFDVLNVNLQRARTDATGTVTETNAATVRAANGVSNSFGRLVATDVSYTHDLTWVQPPAATFTGATLTISAFGALSNNDIVTLDATFTLGSLDAGVLFNQTVFGGAGVLSALNDNGRIAVSINKNADAPFGGNGLNAFSVFASRLEAQYDIPEPTSLWLVGLALGGSAVRFRRRR